MATIEDVAKKVGVSVTTVSRALNNHPYVSEKTQKLIFEAMETMNYTPNRIAQQLRGKQTKLIGVIISRVTNPFFSYLVDAIEQVAYRNGYQVVVLQTLEDKNREINFLQMLQAKQIDGLIMTNAENSYKTLKRYIDLSKVVICNRYTANDEMPIIKIDEHLATHEAVTYLLTKGYTNIAYLTGGSIQDTDFRLQGFISAHQSFGVSYNEELFFPNILTIEDGKNWTKTICSFPKKPDAVFANGDLVAAGVIGQSYDENIKIPDELAVLGFDDQPIASLVYPKLTTIRQPIQEMGEYAAEILFSKLLGTRAPKQIDLKTSLIIREST
ncbi:LacI family DNA-binding transcriptional regulator [Gracilibacillus timonensis]|uniref:LacI family DNA-binding transcriptional regulator n=1 Tax=Gracilibacillus timonensis TaxID=1816696 RepID=UPI000826F33C|nr:LacI family DNA-binding transcriptional regulator [Gracilibacillus timonensis]